MLSNISPVDGRYKGKTEELQKYFSEFGLIYYRLYVEIEYLMMLENIGVIQISEDDKISLRAICSNFSIDDAEEIKKIEHITNHDVKAVEYFIKNKIEHLEVNRFREFVHFGLTSQDINNTAIPLSLKKALEDVIIPKIDEVISNIHSHANAMMAIPLLARTHGQPASPTTMGKEWMVFVERLQNQMSQLTHLKISAKFGGATGNFNAHCAAFPDINWPEFADNFVGEKLGMERQQWTTQIAHYDQLASVFNALSRINVILIDFCRDIWTYVSMNYFKQKVKAGEVGSSAMPHKVNPIDFENAEGNLGIANAILNHFAAKLPISRLQRDLTDSTVTRNIGVPLGHMLISLKSIEKGLAKLDVNASKMREDLDNNWAVIAEAIQNILRREHYPNPYEALKELTRGKESISQKDLSDFIDGLSVSEEVKSELKSWTPTNYLGILNN